MNILITSLQVPGAASGVRVHYERLAVLLRSQGHEVTVVTLEDVGPWAGRIIGAIRHSLALLPGRLGKRLGVELSEVAKIYFAIDHRQPYDVVNAQDVSSGWAARLALRDRVPVVVTGHYNDHPGEEVIKQLRLKPRSWAARFELGWYNFLLRRTRFFLSISDYALRLTKPLLPAATCTTVVHNGVDMVSFAGHYCSRLARAVPRPADYPQYRAARSSQKPTVPRGGGRRVTAVASRLHNGAGRQGRRRADAARPYCAAPPEKRRGIVGLPHPGSAPIARYRPVCAHCHARKLPLRTH
jgi:hypothetical protein